MADTGLYVTRWLDESTASCIKEDGVQSNWDYLLIPHLEFTHTVENAQRLIVDELINDELIDAWDPEDETIFVVPPAADFHWVQDEMMSAWTCHWKGDIVARAIITKLERKTNEGD